MESTNIGFYSSMVEQGTGEAMVIATGDNTVLGKMSKLTRGSAGDEVTGLHREVNRFVLFVVLATIGAIIILWITWGAWLNRDHHSFVTYNNNIVNSIGMIVGFLPMGLPSAVTLGNYNNKIQNEYFYFHFFLVLTIVAKQMYRQRVLVKSLQIVETFNSVSVIATDKTGTLTQNKMTVTHLLWDTDGVYKVPIPKIEAATEENIFQTIRRLSSGAIDTARRLSVGAASMVRKLSAGNINQPQRMTSFNDDNEKNSIPNEASEVCIQAFRDLLLGASLCNNAEKQLVQDAQIGQDASKMKSELRVVGDAADTALYNLCVERCFVDIDRVRGVNPRLKVLPFNSINKFMISANELESLDISMPEKDRTVLILLKGAPDIVIDRCSTYKTNNDNLVPLDANMKRSLYARQEELGKNGYRVIAMSQQRCTRQQYDDMMQSYKDKQRSQASQVGDDLGGFPSNDYCFLGLFSLLDPPRPEVPDAVLKARRAQIRVAMVTGDHPTTAKAIAKQVHILTPEIAEINGVDTFKLEKNADGQPILNLYRNDKLIEQHLPGEVSRTDSLSKNAKSMIRQVSIEAGEQEPQEPPWYTRAWSSCRNQFREPATDVEPTQKMDYIPYAIVVPGSDINHMDDFMWDWVLSHQELVFARTSPEQKLRIVMEFQRRAEVVAVTGDGTNDAPALKCAHLGVAMQSGTEVSKEAGDMILLDNNFSSIIQAIETGRLLSDNLKKVAIYLLPGGKVIRLITYNVLLSFFFVGSWSQIWPVFFNLWFGMPLALSAFLATVFCMINGMVIEF
jgi:magnesium-transporting ATPase (P-type)